jgi:hypothetical protein
MEGSTQVRKTILTGAGAAMFAFGLLLALTAVASAHERRNVQDYTFVVGWLNEPALLNQPNSIDLRVSKTADSSPVTGLEKTVKAEVVNGSDKLAADLTPRFNTPGAYNSYLTPTKEGVYSFHFTGTIEGNTVNETFTSGPGTFGSIEAPKAFPRDLPLVQSVNEATKSLEQRVVSLESRGSTNKADTALIIAIVALVAGGLGLAVGGYGLSRRPSA